VALELPLIGEAHFLVHTINKWIGWDKNLGHYKVVAAMER